MILTRFFCSVVWWWPFLKGATGAERCWKSNDLDGGWPKFLFIKIFFFITPGIKHVTALVRDEPSVCPTYLLFLQQHNHDARVAVIRVALPSRRVISTSEVRCQLLLLSVWYPSVTLKGRERCLPDDIFCPPPTPPPSLVHFQFV